MKEADKIIKNKDLEIEVISTVLAGTLGVVKN